MHPDTLFVRACYRQPVDRTPVWIMRQAGRYLPAYQALRQKYDFTTLYKSPELAAEVTLQPIAVLGVDAAIIFSDILVIAEAMGMKLSFSDAKGPTFAQAVREESEIARLELVTPDRVAYVLDAIRLVKKEVAGKIAVIGFCGAPWTVGAYMVEGASSHQFYTIKKMRFARPDLLHRLLDKLAVASIVYCQAQIEAGADAIQIFDPAAGLLDDQGFREFVLPYIRKIIQAIQRPSVPIIYFSKGTMQWLADLALLPAEVIGLDWTVSLQTARQIVGEKKVLQGNMDPATLYAPEATIRAETERMLQQYGVGSGHIVNLGHGILPDTPVAHAQAFVQAVREFSPQYHQ